MSPYTLRHFRQYGKAEVYYVENDDIDVAIYATDDYDVARAFTDALNDAYNRGRLTELKDRRVAATDELMALSELVADIAEAE